ncbi:MAG: VOC family protein [Candidatus Sungbacteria bacterium]|nr:VOC family protein [Candidatus Sungbacteria bacterium]
MPDKKKWQWLKEDHITYAVWDIQFWRYVYTANLGFREIHHTADATPHGQSSMELYGLEQGGSRIALVRPINRSALSHVESFLRMHGDHSVQHGAYGIRNLEAFVAEMKEKGFHFVGKVKQRTDLFGPIKQIFAKRFDATLTPAQGPFFEFVERPERMDGAGIADFYASSVAGELYEDVEEEIAKAEQDCFVSGIRKIAEGD